MRVFYPGGRKIQIAENIVHFHHEKWNGEGYPDHFSGISIPTEARIMALADVYCFEMQIVFGIFL